jgi:RNA recognition motif-containing protein
MAGCLFVGDMSVCCRESHLQELFQEYGKVVRIEIKKCSEAFKFQGYGFVTMSTLEEAENAISGLNGLLYKGRKLRLRIIIFH